MTIPHLVQYQGSKRLLAKKIIAYMPSRFTRLIEPFSGTAAISIAAAYNGRTTSFHVNDLNAPLIKMFEAAIMHPQELINGYRRIWRDQFGYADGHIQHFYHIREKFNNNDKSPEIMLYLLARCAKGSIRYGKGGNFNQSPDKRRHGTKPEKMAENINALSSLLKDKITFSSLDYKDVLQTVNNSDLVYMDPPYQGVCDKRDNRYLSGIDYNEFTETLNLLNARNIDYIISYDGQCGEKVYGKDLPPELKCKKIVLNAGLSSQETLLGRKAVTLESLYISESLYKTQICSNIPTSETKQIDGQR